MKKIIIYTTNDEVVSLHLVNKIVTNEKTAEAIMSLYEIGPEERSKVGQKARDYVLSEFSLEKTIDLWDKSMLDLLDKWENNRESVYKSWRMKVLGRK